MKEFREAPHLVALALAASAILALGCGGDNKQASIEQQKKDVMGGKMSQSYIDGMSSQMQYPSDKQPAGASGSSTGSR